MLQSALEQVDREVAGGALLAVSSALRCHAASLATQTVGLEALCCLLSGRRADRLRAVIEPPAAVHEPVLAAMRQFPTDARLQSIACDALRLIGLDRDAKELLMRPPHCAHDAILQCLDAFQTDARVAQSAVGAIGRLAANGAPI